MVGIIIGHVAWKTVTLERTDPPIGPTVFDVVVQGVLKLVDPIADLSLPSGDITRIEMFHNACGPTVSLLWVSPTEFRLRHQGRQLRVFSQRRHRIATHRRRPVVFAEGQRQLDSGDPTVATKGTQATQGFVRAPGTVKIGVEQSACQGQDQYAFGRRRALDQRSRLFGIRGHGVDHLRHPSREPLVLQSV